MSTDTTTWRMWAHAEDDGTFTHLGHRRYVERHLLDLPIVEVEVRLAADDDPAATHWGWIGSRPGDEDEPVMIWPSWPAYSCCFTYGPKAEEEAGKGRTVRLQVGALDGEGPSE